MILFILQSWNSIQPPCLSQRMARVSFPKITIISVIFQKKWQQIALYIQREGIASKGSSPPNCQIKAHFLPPLSLSKEEEEEEKEAAPNLSGLINSLVNLSVLLCFFSCICDAFLASLSRVLSRSSNIGAQKTQCDRCMNNELVWHWTSSQLYVFNDLRNIYMCVSFDNSKSECFFYGNAQCKCLFPYHTTELHACTS